MAFDHKDPNLLTEGAIGLDEGLRDGTAAPEFRFGFAPRTRMIGRRQHREACEIDQTLAALNDRDAEDAGVAYDGMVIQAQGFLTLHASVQGSSLYASFSSCRIVTVRPIPMR
jgi:hypothetical protein